MIYISHSGASNVESSSEECAHWKPFAGFSATHLWRPKYAGTDVGRLSEIGDVAGVGKSWPGLLRLSSGRALAFGWQQKALPASDADFVLIAVIALQLGISSSAGM